MIYDAIKVFNSSASFTFKIKNPSLAERYILKTIEGLGAPDIDFYSARNADYGSNFQGALPVPREIGIRLKLNPAYGFAPVNPSDLRSALYPLIAVRKKDISTVQLLNGTTVVAQTTGYVKGIDTSIFTVTPEVVLRISCVDSYLTEPTEKTYNVSGWSKTSFTMAYTGSAPTGFQISLKFTSSCNSILFAAGTDEEMLLLPVTGNLFAANDILVVDTRRGFKKVTKNGIDILDRATFVNWMELRTGSNNWTITVASGATFDWVSAKHFVQHWGV